MISREEHRVNEHNLEWKPRDASPGSSTKKLQRIMGLDHSNISQTLFYYSYETVIGIACFFSLISTAFFWVIVLLIFSCKYGCSE